VGSYLPGINVRLPDPDPPAGMICSWYGISVAAGRISFFLFILYDMCLLTKFGEQTVSMAWVRSLRIIFHGLEVIIYLVTDQLPVIEKRIGSG